METCDSVVWRLFEIFQYVDRGIPALTAHRHRTFFRRTSQKTELMLKGCVWTLACYTDLVYAGLFYVRHI